MSAKSIFPSLWKILPRYEILGSNFHQTWKAYEAKISNQVFCGFLQIGLFLYIPSTSTRNPFFVEGNNSSPCGRCLQMAMKPACFLLETSLPLSDSSYFMTFSGFVFTSYFPELQSLMRTKQWLPFYITIFLSS